ncbi:tRNA (adenine(37)-N6)-methyltransferase [Cololabis saira]|uniref:tRNA (adenine(37)-N6)-methyltransferase n=1 Tax=Cololabis saira TaxID=129043 RepID=UPI002AD5A907|nr:tRNA (adenine(37)-N6)-methyltransferase [Cololabis saira]
MSPLCNCCNAQIDKLNQQVSVMRKEIKNLRQMLDSGARAHRKHLASVQAAVSKISLCEAGKAATPPPSLQAALEQGNVQTVPIGFISSCFAVKNGTPRQPTICGPSRAELRVQQSVFNNPDHALVGLEQYSHVWIIFLFHKNGHLSYKAKVKPPRLNGQRVGVYSTRSPHRPNALGLTLAKLDKIKGDTLHLSDIDMIAGTPVLDIKPYIPEYDSPDSRKSLETQRDDSNADQADAAAPLNKETRILNHEEDLDTDLEFNNKTIDEEEDGGTKDSPDHDVSLTESSKVRDQLFLPKVLSDVLEDIETFVNRENILQPCCEKESQISASGRTKPSASTMDVPRYGEEAYTAIAGWIREPPVANLDVRFTPHAERQLAEFLPADQSGPSDSDRPRFRFLRSADEATAAIRGVLSADPRSVYRRTRCKDRLFFFALDTADVTCWFGQGFAEVLQVRPVERHFPSV